MIQALAFDFGKVIGFFDHGRTLAKLTPHTDMSTADMFVAIFGGDLENEFESGRIDEQEFLRRFRSLCRLRCDDAFLAGTIADIFWPNEPLCALIPQLKERYRLILGSNTNPIHARHFVPQFADTLGHFDALVLSHEIRARKPDRAFFEQVVRVADCPAEHCVFIDDLPANIAGARACGLHGIVYNGFDGLLAAFRQVGVVLER